MRPPPWGYNPKWYLALCFGVAVAAAGWLAGSWFAGTWTPSSTDGIHLFWGFVAGFMWMLPEYIMYRRSGDGYARDLLTRRYGGYLAGRPWWFIVAKMTCYMAFFMSANPHFSPIGFGGVALGLACWGPYIKSLWQRMWELYEQEAAATTAPAPPSPTPGVSGTT